jgi:hypothetical protein
LLHENLTFDSKPVAKLPKNGYFLVNMPVKMSWQNFES